MWFRAIRKFRLPESNEEDLEKRKARHAKKRHQKRKQLVWGRRGFGPRDLPRASVSSRHLPHGRQGDGFAQSDHFASGVEGGEFGETESQNAENGPNMDETSGELAKTFPQ